MEVFLERAKKNINLDENIYQSIRNIIISESYFIKFENFNNLMKYIEKMKNDYNNLFAVFLLYIYDINKDFKNDLMLFLKDKNNLSLLKNIAENFFEYIEFEKDCDYLEYSRMKLKIFINFYDLLKFVIIFDSYIICVNYNKYFTLILKDLKLHFQNINDEINQHLIFFFKNFSFFYKTYYNKVPINPNLLDMIDNDFNSHLDYVLNFDKELEINFSNAYFLILSLNNNYQEYISKSINVIKKFENEPNYLLIFIKGFLINIFPQYFSINTIVHQKFDLFNIFLNKFVVNSYNHFDNLSIFEFYNIFLKNDFKGNYTNYINDLFLISLQKIDKLEFNQSPFSNEFIQSIMDKMNRDKNAYNIMDDNYYYIIEVIIKLDNDKKIILNDIIYNYLSNILEKNEKFMIIESKLFKFIDYDIKKNVNLLKNFFVNIFSRKYDKKNIRLLNGYIKTLCDYFFKEEKNKIISITKINNFLSVFTNPFFNYLNKIEIKDLRFFNNLMTNIEKFNKNLFAILVYEYYKLYIYNNQNSNDYLNKFAVFLILIKPFRDHKKSNSFVDDNYVFELKIQDDYIINIKISVKDLKDLAKSIDRYLVIYLIEFIVGLENYEKTFPLIKTIIKYNLKSSYVEYKTSVLKMMIIYFNSYVNKLVKLLNKNKISNDEIYFIESSLNNFDYLFKFLNNNIYDRPMENLLTYLEILKLNLDLFEKFRDCKNDLKYKFSQITSVHIFQNYFTMSLISLLIKSWYFIKSISFEILKKKEFHAILKEHTNVLIMEIENHVYSLRQTDTEGSIYLFMIMYHHFQDVFLNKIVVKENSKFNNVDITPQNNPISILELFISSIKIRFNNYLNFIKEPEIKNKNNDNYYIHSFFIFIRAILETDKEKVILIDSERIFSYTENLLELALYIYEINDKFKLYLINNGVSEFSIDENIDELVGDSEDKRLISLWCTTKYSIECLDLIFDIIQNNYKIISESDKFIQILTKLEICQDININLMIDSKHMGAVRIFDATLLKISRLLNKSESKYIKYNECTFNHLKNLIEFKLNKKELSSILRRSAGIPFLITTLIKSFINNDKISCFSHNQVIKILKYSIDRLIYSYIEYQYLIPDTSVHCLHILRVITDDTSLKPFTREFYNIIILSIIEGLNQENWSIKNACMLLFSRLIKSSFMLDTHIEKYIPTFVEYFNDKNELKQKIFTLISNDINSNNNECSSILVILVNFISKFKFSKKIDIMDNDLRNFIYMLLKLGYKKNHIFRKVLSNCIVKLYGENIGIIVEFIKDEFKKCNIDNNTYDFLFYLLEEIIKLNTNNYKDIITNILDDLNEQVTKQKNYFLVVKLKKIALNEGFTYNEKSKSNIFEDIIDFNNICSILKEKSKLPFYHEYMKNNIIDTILNEKKKINNFRLEKVNQNNEEIVEYILKKNPELLIDENILIDLLNIDISKISVNISIRIFNFIQEKIIFIEKANLEKLLRKILTLIKDNKNLTKLNKRLLILLGLLYKNINNHQYFKEIYEIIYSYAKSNNEEKIRYSSLFCLENVINNFNLGLLYSNFSSIMKIFVIYFNDEHPEIRNNSCQIFNNIFAERSNIFKLRKNIVFSNEYLLKQILCININENKIILDEITNFYNFLIKENLYFYDNMIYNNQDKIFFYEPDNRYIDNIEIKINILYNRIINSLATISNNFDDIKKLNIFVMLENFVLYLSNNFFVIEDKLIKEFEDIDKKQIKYLIFDYLRKNI